jgi:uncharacterized protein (TIGR02265 family)
MRAFAPVDLSRAVDLNAHLGALPKNATIKGMFFDYVAEIGSSHIQRRELYKTAGVEPRRYVPFLDYPARDYMRLLYTAASAMSPSVSRGLHRIGLGIYPLFKTSIVGKTMFEVFGRSPDRTLPHGHRGWAVSMNFGEVTTEIAGTEQIVYSFKNLPLFLSCYQFGVIAGALEAIGTTGEVTASLYDIGNADFHVQWQ